MNETRGIAWLIINSSFLLAQLIAFIFLYRAITDVLAKIEIGISIQEIHARLEKEQKEKLVDVMERSKVEAKMAATTAAVVAKEAAKEAASEVRTVLEQMPRQVVEEIKKSSDSADSKDRIPVVNVNLTQQ